MHKRTTLIAGLVLSALACVPSFAGGTIVKVELQDVTNDGTMKSMQMKLDHASVKAGPVTFQVTNESKALVHEMLVIPTKLEASALPYDAKKDAFIESTVKSLGEVEELRPGKSGELTLKLNAGPYLLACNQPGHLHAGMWTKFTVNP
jgi:uncharacterized cupredoxin-like copper-binding protein